MSQNRADAHADTPGKRLYLIRLALGDGLKNPLRIKDFVALVRAKTGVAYDASQISRAENGGRELTLADVSAFAAVDPLERGRDWLAWHNDATETVTLEGTTYRDVTEDVGGHDARVAEGAKLTREAAAKKKAAEDRRRNGG